jgi:DNA-binding protein HU-beta
LNFVTKPEFIEHLAVRAELSRNDAGRALDAMLALVQDTLRDGGEVALSGFGKFHVGTRAARAGVNPRTGEPIAISATRVPRFTAGSGLKKAVRGQH